MAVADVVEWTWGIESVQKSLEEVSTLLSASESDPDTGSGHGIDSEGSLPVRTDIVPFLLNRINAGQTFD